MGLYYVYTYFHLRIGTFCWRAVYFVYTTLKKNTHANIKSSDVLYIFHATLFFFFKRIFVEEKNEAKAKGMARKKKKEGKMEDVVDVV